MAEQMTVGGLDFGALRRAIEGRDAEALAGFYADDAQIRTVNKNVRHLRDVCGREMTHRVEDEVVGEGRVAFVEACEYPDGVRVLGAATLEVRAGKIVRQVNVEAWDE